MSPEAAEAVVLDHLTATLPAMTDTELAEVQAEHVVETGHYAVEARRLIDKEREARQAIRHAEETAWAELVAEMCPPTYWTAGGAK